MRLTKLILEQFRNYPQLEISFNPDEAMTYIVGPNAQGKTNILESIYLLALTKSFRTTRQQEMIGWEHEYARVKGFFEVEDATNQSFSNNQNNSGRPYTEAELAALAPQGPARPADSTVSLNSHAASTSETILEAFLGKPPHPQKAFKKNDVKISAAQFIGTCQVVFFHPEDLNMLYLGPDLRRAYLNVMNVQVNRKYFSALRSYQKVLKQRNALLHAIRDNRADINELDVWDEQLIQHGSYLMQERANTVEYFQSKLTDTYQKISEGDEKVKIIYRHTLNFFNDPTFNDFVVNNPENQNLQSQSTTHWSENFAKDLQNSRPRDLQALVTTVGPHRDDLEFSLNGLKLSALASRGEYRSLLLSLKLIELKFFEERSNQKPLLLLDDVFSELDPNRQNLLLQAIEGHQTIITTTHLNDPNRLHRSLKESGITPPAGKYLEVTQGKIHEHIDS